jgi:hypothetical protein
MSQPESGPKSEPSKAPPGGTERRKAVLRERVVAGAILAATFIVSMVISKASGDTAEEQSVSEGE